MTWTRREFLVCSATICAGAAIANSVAALLRNPTTGPVRLLTSQGDTPWRDFERGVHAGLDERVFAIDALVMPVRSDLSGWRALLPEIRGSIVLGVVTASEFVLVNELIREAGARQLYRGEHLIDNTGSARHNWTTSNASLNVQAALSGSPGGWPEALGLDLARVVAHRKHPAARMTETSAGQARGPLRSSYVSFVFAG